MPAAPAIRLTVNGAPLLWEGDPSTPLLTVLRRHMGLTAAKDGCSGQAACGACLVEIDAKAALACSTPMSKLEGAHVLTLEGFPEALRQTLAAAFLNRGAVQCGFCTPGFLTRAKILLQSNPDPSRDEVIKAVRPHLCRCTGYQPLVDAILDAAKALRENAAPPITDPRPGAGSSWPKYGGMERALGMRPFVDDLTEHDLKHMGHMPPLACLDSPMAHGALVFSAHPRARVLAIHREDALAMPGVIRVLTALDVPGRQCTGMFIKDWPVFIKAGAITRYRGDVLACVVAESEEQARAAARAVSVEYQVLPALFDPQEALVQHEKSPSEHPLFVEEAATSNVLLDKSIRRGPEADAVTDAEFDTDDLLARCAFSVQAEYSVPAVEHAFLETECCLAVPVAQRGANVPENGPAGPLLYLYDQAQGIWHNREDIAAVLNLPSDAVSVTLVDTGGAFGGKEDISVQAHAALAAWLTGRPVKVRLSRPESLRMHPKRHAMRLHCALGCDKNGKLQVAKMRVLADAGAYASVSSAVVTRTGTHATGVYHIPYVDVRVQAVYTNNIPAGAFRGFGVNQSNFALESTVDMLCAKGSFDPWQFRYDNAVTEGSMISTGQILGPAVGIRESLEAVKKDYDAHPRAGLACAIKNAGIGNGVPEPCDCFLSITPEGGIRIDHGWTEMGQGLHTVARQMVCEALNLGKDVPFSVHAVTESGAFAGSTTASRGTFQMGHALLEAAAHVRKALPSALFQTPKPLAPADLLPLAGQKFQGHYDCDGQTTAEGPPGVVRNHVSYSFATHVAFLDEKGRVERILAAHDSGRVINRALYESQVTGGVAMGLGYALSEGLTLVEGRLAQEKLNACGLLRATDMPRIDVIAVEKPDPAGPLGAKGLGEISSIPTTAAVINALARFSAKRCFHLPWREKH